MTINPRVGEPNLADQPGVARALQVTFMAILASALGIFAVTLFLLRWAVTPWLALLGAAASGMALAMGRSGWTRSGGLVALAGLAYCVLHAAAVNDGMESTGLTVIPVVIIVGSLVLDRLMFVVFSAGAVLATAGMLAIRYYVLRLEQYSVADAGDFFIFAVVCATAAVVGRLLSSRIEAGFRELRASERSYRRMFDNIHDVYYEMRADGALVELSPSGAVLFGAPRESMIGRSLAHVCADPSAFDALVADVLRLGAVVNRELQIRQPAGAPVFVLITASLHASDTGEQSIIGSIREVTERRRAEGALRVCEARLRIALEAAGAGTFEFYPRSGKLIWSDITKSHFGLPPGAEIDHDLFMRAVHPDDRERVRQASDLAADRDTTRGELAIEYRVIGVQDGKERWIASRGRMFFDAENHGIRLIGTTQDISARKRLEEQLRRSLEELQTIMDVAPVALLTAHDPECRVVTLNRMGNAMLELDPGSNSASAPGGPVPPVPFFRNGVEVPVHELPLQTAARGVEVRDSELEVRLPSGRTKILWGHASPLRDLQGRVRGAIGAVQDVTEARLRAEALLRESEERFRNTADAAPVILWFGDAETKVTFVNEQFVRFTGVPAEDLLGHGWMQVIHPDDLDHTRGVYYGSVRDRATYQVECRARRADGEYRHMLATTGPRYIGGEYAGQMGSVIDITDLKRRQEESVTRQKLESVGLLAGGVAHHFNNLLGGVLAQAELALSELDAGAAPANELNRIVEVARRGSEIVRQLMIYAGKEKEASAFIDVSQTVNDMLALLGVSISKFAVLKTDLASDLPAIRADAAQIRQVVLNLATNASEALADLDGVIQVSTRAVTRGPAATGADGEPLRQGDYVQLEVADTGCGMTPETRASLFDPYFTTKFAGRGLGLAVVQGIVRTLEGAITVVSEPGKGTTVRVLFPCSAKSAPPARVAASRAESTPAPSQAPAVLIVEDEDRLREPVAKLLRNRQFTVIEAADGCEALAAIRACPGSIDFILLDITLPGSSSREVFEEARRLMPAAGIIATSGYDEKAAAAALDGKPDAFIRKPYRSADLVKLLRHSAGSTR
jgi:two-component system cell cycle sensor histidine kinase/response regulator CckA